MFLISSYSCHCPIHWSRVLIQEWRCGWGSADRRCSNYIWVIDTLGWRALKTPTFETPHAEVTWPQPHFNNSGPDPLGFDWEDLTGRTWLQASWWSQGPPPLNSSGMIPAMSSVLPTQVWRYSPMPWYCMHIAQQWWNINNLNSK